LGTKHIEERGAGGTCNKKSVTHLELWTQKNKEEGGVRGAKCNKTK